MFFQNNVITPPTLFRFNALKSSFDLRIILPMLLLLVVITSYSIHYTKLYDEIRPDRLVTFSYAHVPWMKENQKILA